MFILKILNFILNRYGILINILIIVNKQLFQGLGILLHAPILSLTVIKLKIINNYQNTNFQLAIIQTALIHFITKIIIQNVIIRK